MSRPAGLITAAGASSRMGARHKATLPWGGHRSLLEHQCSTLLHAGLDEVIVVVGARAERVQRCVPDDARVRVVHNERWQEGRSTSFAAGASAVSPDTRWLLICAVDQPLFLDNVQRMLAAAVNSPGPLIIAQDSATGRDGHPIMLDDSLWPLLRDAESLPEGLRSVVAPARPAALRVPCGHPTRLDLNTPEGFQDAHARFGSAGQLDGRRRT